MDHRIDDDDTQLRAALLRFLRERLPDPGAEPDRARRRAAWSELVAAEWLEHFSTSFADGDGAGAVAALHVAEAFGVAPVPGPADTVAGYLIPLVAATGWSAAADRLRDGSLVTAVVPGLTEPGPDRRARYRAERCTALTGAGMTSVSGTVAGVPCAADADALVVAVDLDGTAALALVDLHGDGVRVGPPRGVDLRRPVGDVVLDAAPAVSVHAPTDLLAHEDAGARRHSLFRDAEAVGAGGELVARTVAYCTERRQFGRPIGSFQAVRHRIADAAARVEGARSLAYRAAWDLATDVASAPVDVVASRLWSSAAAVTAGEAAVQCHGGMGFTWEQGVHVFYRAALAGRGDAAVRPARAVIAAHLRDLAGGAAPVARDGAA
ncbi:acyl-CoA dehydrogenase family protein [Pseudonocardia sp. WMMC193]|uniref:acyl-CoA dehydrogenase family protein n=1 Tax=Pseudonocardia sp. WMMC193 TaxID=2911965 RepID=UPI001F45515C|nr:acyl-CoA dehydrogenase family protein [Pseudonocardia sp. WMMC193]MCF7550795.1 acyl-CoA/acyl-ACP dehydrogenase [Pseudonocardia sp. WMMC193]